MTVINKQSGTNVHEVAERIYRISTPTQIPGGGAFSFNQYLLLDDDPLLWHTGPRKMFPLVREAVASLMPVGRLQYVGLSHVPRHARRLSRACTGAHGAATAPGCCGRSPMRSRPDVRT
jgi:flavorubredoxin